MGGEVTEKQYLKMLDDVSTTATVTRKCCPRDPANLAIAAMKAKRSEDKASCSKDGGPYESYSATFVLTDVDEFSSDKLRSAERTCKAEGMRLIISNPCFEVWLIDHERTCSSSWTSTKECERQAHNLGLTTGRNNKEIVKDKLAPHINAACKNVASHRTQEHERLRNQLDTTDFAPWTDMPTVVDAVVPDVRVG
jgi:hypothetical protein